MKTGRPGASSGWIRSSARTAYGVSGSTSRAAEALAPPVPAQKRASPVELDERAARIERAELLDPVLAPRPGCEGGAELRLERVVAGEDPSRLLALPRLVERRGASELARLGVVSDPERERERREAGARLQLGGALDPATSSAESTAAPATTTAASAASAATMTAVRARADTRPD